MTPRAEADRAAFEEWAAKANYNLARMVASENEKDIGQYEMRGTQWAWEAWQAARTPSASGWASAIEAAAKVCEDQYAEPQWHPLYRNASCVIAAAIRALPPATAMEDSAMVERVARAIDEVLTNALAPQPEHTNTAAARAALAVIQG